MSVLPVSWDRGCRIIRAIYPPVDLFEDLTTDPSTWELLASFEAKTNPRIQDQVGNLALVPPNRRIHGESASLAMGCFTHVSMDRPGRFSDGSFGVWYCGNSVQVALAETAHHFEAFMGRTNEPAEDADFNLLVCKVGGTVVRAGEDCLGVSYEPGQRFAAAQREANLDGVLYPSVRYPDGMALALFWPDCLTLPIVRSANYRYRWDGSRMTHFFEHGGGNPAWKAWPIAGARP